LGPGGGGDGADGSAEAERPLDKTFGFEKNFVVKYKLIKEVGREHFGHTCSVVIKKGDYKDHTIVVKIISKAKVRATLEVMVLLSNLTFGSKRKMNRRISKHYLLTIFFFLF
jgi:hypothetical protein